jgi:hypothetical protein
MGESVQLLLTQRVTFIVQIFGYLYYRQRYMIADAFGSFGRSVIDAIAGIFRN